MAGKRALALGIAEPSTAIGVAAQGAHVIAITSEADDLDRARAAVDAAEAKVELHAGDLADLAFIRADTVDAAWSDGALRTTTTSTGSSARCTGCSRPTPRSWSPSPTRRSS